MNIINNKKQVLRNTLRKMLQSQSISNRSIKSSLICEKIKQLSLFKSAQVILFYYPLSEEVDLLPLARSCLQNSKKVLFPYIFSRKPPKLAVTEINDFNQFQEGLYNVQEPSLKTSFDVKKIDLFLIPGLAFDLKGHRLGRGKGYFDRFLSECSQLDPDNIKKRVGVGFDFQLIKDVPCDVFDQKMGNVVIN